LIDALDLIKQIQGSFLSGMLEFGDLKTYPQGQDYNDQAPDAEKAVKRIKSNILDDFLKQPKVMKIQTDVANFKEYMKEMNSLDGWTRFQDTPEAKIYYKKEDGYSCVTCFLETAIDASVYQTAAIFAEVELFKDWAPITPESKKLTEVTPFRKLVYLRNNL
jgi:hypothetical protein